MARSSGRGTGAGSAVDARVVRTHNDVLRAALVVLIDQGWEAVTHPEVARAAGYSRATLYNHWPTRSDLVRAAFSRLGDMPHHTPTGDLRADLIQELTSFRTGMERDRLDRALTVLVDLTASHPELGEIRDKLVNDGERVVRELLGSQLRGSDLEAATLMLCGAVLHSALMHGRLPSDEVIAATVDMSLCTLQQRRPPEPRTDPGAAPG